MSLIIVDPRSRVPIYEQLIQRVKSLIYSKELKADDPMPSVRSLASELAINPNTIQRAYAALEAEGVIYSLPARGSFVSDNTQRVIDSRKNELIERLASLLKELKELGCDPAEVKVVMDLAWRDIQ
ncbi:MAG: GntR family transcriptional regulator [Clostridiales bacterium]|nr:GntR family transcriptional regulator [Clostridiales bacterium]